jgi:molybdopterin-containing oxidoreductase family membrane subunit
MYVVHNRATGPYAWAYWVTLTCNVFIPQLLWFRKVRINPKPLFFVAAVVLYGMWIERYMIIVTSLHRDFLPSSWTNFVASIWDVSLLVGSIGLFVVCFMLFVRFLPMISIFEVRELLPFSRPGGGTEK